MIVNGLYRGYIRLYQIADENSEPQPLTGKGTNDFTIQTTKGGSPVSLAVTITEVSAAQRPGLYKIETTPTESNDYRIEIELTGNTVNPKFIIDSQSYLYDMDSSFVQVLPFSGSVSVGYAKAGTVTEIVAGDTVSIPYDIDTNLTGKKIYFAAKASESDTTYAIAVKEITSYLTDVVNGLGTIPLISAETILTAGIYKAELEIRNTDGTSPVTAMKFDLRVKAQVITA